MNGWIALCTKDPTFPHPLRDLNYNAETIEPVVHLKGARINPDIVLTTKKFNHAIVVDCKSRTLKKKQMDKYKELKTEPTVLVDRGTVDVPNRDHLTIDIAISSFDDLSDRPLLNEDEHFAFVHFVHGAGSLEELARIVLSPDHRFAFSKLDRCFPVDLGPGQRIPTEYYPFDVDDTEQFIISLLRTVVRFAIKGTETFDSEDLLQEAHPFWPIMGAGKRREMKRAAERVIARFKRRGLDEHIHKIRSGKNQWKIVSKSFQALERKCQVFIKEMEDALKQKKLDEYQL